MTITFDRVYRHDDIDKSTWDDGPWQHEFEKYQWVDAETDLDCLIVRNRSGALCGYVGVPESHPLYGKDYNEIDEFVEVHGGLTFADACHEGPDPAHGICHVPLPGRPGEVWWFGFDCAHFMDLSPAMNAYLRERGIRSESESGMFGEVYRTVDYVVAECQALAGQLLRATMTPEQIDAAIAAAETFVDTGIFPE